LEIKITKTINTHDIVLQGQIIDLYDKSELGFARIELISNKKSYLRDSDRNGNFKFRDVLPGKYIINTSYVGYYDFKDSLHVKQGELIELKISLGYGY